MFLDRYDAGKQLANKLLKYKGKKTVVYAIPRGGALTALEVARALEAPLDVVIARKIGHPFNKELAVCAITEDGKRTCDEVGVCCVDSSWLESETTLQLQEIKRQRQVFQGTAKLMSAKGKTAILVDDGIATGLTIKAAVLAIQKQKPEKIIIAVPVAPRSVIEELMQQVDEVVVLRDEPDFKGDVSSCYIHFPEVIDAEVQLVLKHLKTKYNQ